VQGVCAGRWPPGIGATCHKRISACLASIRKGVYRQTKSFTSAFIQRIETGGAEKFFLKGKQARTLTWNSESFFQTEKLSTFARRVIPFATYPAISLNTSVHRSTCPN